jgi:hypothetical protein
VSLGDGDFLIIGGTQDDQFSRKTFVFAPATSSGISLGRGLLPYVYIEGTVLLDPRVARWFVFKPKKSQFG